MGIYNKLKQKQFLLDFENVRHNFAMKSHSGREKEKYFFKKGSRGDRTLDLLFTRQAL